MEAAHLAPPSPLPITPRRPFFRTSAARRIFLRRPRISAASRPQRRDKPVVSGGVASNRYARTHLNHIAEKNGLQLICPPPSLCTDNGVLIAWTGIEHFIAGRFDDPPAALLLMSLMICSMSCIQGATNPVEMVLYCFTITCGLSVKSMLALAELQVGKDFEIPMSRDG
ncbi:hypothetical protein ABZP36_027053 [Zizania latifolia]